MLLLCCAVCAGLPGQDTTTETLTCMCACMQWCLTRCQCTSCSSSRRSAAVAGREHQPSLRKLSTSWKCFPSRSRKTAEAAETRQGNRVSFLPAGAEITLLQQSALLQQAALLQQTASSSSPHTSSVVLDCGYDPPHQQSQAGGWFIEQGVPRDGKALPTHSQGHEGRHLAHVAACVCGWSSEAVLLPVIKLKLCR